MPVKDEPGTTVVLTHDPRWKYTPAGHAPFWASLDTVEYVTTLLEQTGLEVVPVETDEAFGSRLERMKREYCNPLVFWLNEFMPTASGRDIFTVSKVEKLGMMHTGPGSRALRTGLDKEATKQVFRRLGLPTPEGYVVYPGDYSPIYWHPCWPGFAIVKPLRQGNSRGMDQFSVVEACDHESVRQGVERIHQQFDEPALVERYIGGRCAREFTVPMLISHDGRVAHLPITEIDLALIPPAQERFRFLTQDMKDEKYYLKIPADLTPDVSTTIYRSARRIVAEIGCADMTRIDLRCDSRTLYYLEVNVVPGKNRFSYLTTSAYTLALDYAEIIAFIPYQAMLKYRLQPPRELRNLVRPVLALFDRPNL